MKNVTRMLVAAVLVLGTQAAWSEVGQSSADAQRPQTASSLLEQLGIGSSGPFPSRGGPIDD